ncbi:MAG: acryloyl-CoA reductase [Candidatus Limnocylindrales bacterium]
MDHGPNGGGVTAIRQSHSLESEDRVERGVRQFAAAELPPGEVTVRIEWSSVNYKDGLATIANGKVARISPLIPGIDLAGEVIASDDPDIEVGSEVLAHGYDLGVSHHGGFAEYNRLPAGWVVPLPIGLGARDAMSIGTAGFTAGLSVARLEARGLDPSDGPVLVTGASGGVGRTAIAILLERGYETWASTGKFEAHADLHALGVAGILARDEVVAESSRPLESERWAAAVDCVGGATLPYLLRSLRYGGAVAASGNTGGAAFSTTVFPFILRGAALIGIDSAAVPIVERRALWDRLATNLRPRNLGQWVTEIDLDGLPGALDSILAGRAHGRWLVRVAG